MHLSTPAWEEQLSGRSGLIVDAVILALAGIELGLQSQERELGVGREFAVGCFGNDSAIEFDGALSRIVRALRIIAGDDVVIVGTRLAEGPPGFVSLGEIEKEVEPVRAMAVTVNEAAGLGDHRSECGGIAGASDTGIPSHFFEGEKGPLARWGIGVVPINLARESMIVDPSGTQLVEMVSEVERSRVEIAIGWRGLRTPGVPEHGSQPVGEEKNHGLRDSASVARKTS